MRNEFTAIIEQEKNWFIAYSPEIQGANGQGYTKEEALKSLRDAISLILELKREGQSHSLWTNPRIGLVEAIPRHREISDLLVYKICRSLTVPEIGRS